MLRDASCSDVISFALGLPAAELFPAAEIGVAIAHTLDRDPCALQYGPASAALRSHVVRLMALRGVTCSEEQVFLTAGAQQGMSLLARLLLEPGGTVISEELIYTGFQQVLMPYECETLTVPTDPDTGIDVDAVDALFARGARPAFIYTIPTGHNPIAVDMSAEKRSRLIDLARSHRVPIVEDDPYGFVSYGESPAAPLRALDPEWVYYIGSFSKILAPALRVGWVVVPERLMALLGVLKEASDIDTATLAQRSIAAFLDAGGFEAHLARLRTEYRSRRDRMLEGLGKHFPDRACWRVPSSGLFVWVALEDGFDADLALRRSLVEERVAFLPGSAFAVHGDGAGRNCLRLSFSHSASDRIDEGITRLGRLLGRWRGP
jgi:2-aminoadipate transaminase